MTRSRCVARFKDGNYLNIEADSIVRDGDYVEAWKRVPPDKILEKGAVYETVGVFSEESFDFIYISESEK